MSVQTETPTALADPPGAPARAARGGIVPFRLSVEQFLKMIDAGILTDRDRVELLGGVLAAKMVKHNPHNFAVGSLAAALRQLLPEGWFVSEEKSVVLGQRWRPEPDIAVVRGPLDRFRQQSPQADDLTMLVEVAESSYAKDRGVKWRHYASCGVASYWIVNLETRTIEVYGDPAGEGREARYRASRSFGPDDEIPVTIDGREVGRVAARDVLP
jgi:Uma2 family endonuclease